jgi:hypothetical protein
MWSCRKVRHASRFRISLIGRFMTCINSTPCTAAVKATLSTLSTRRSALEARQARRRRTNREVREARRRCDLPVAPEDLHLCSGTRHGTNVRHTERRHRQHESSQRTEVNVSALRTNCSSDQPFSLHCAPRADKLACQTLGRAANRERNGVARTIDSSPAFMGFANERRSISASISGESSSSSLSSSGSGSTFGAVTFFFRRGGVDLADMMPGREAPADEPLGERETRPPSRGHPPARADGAGARAETPHIHRPVVETRPLRA